MPKALAGLALVGFVAIMTSVSAQKGCRDLVHSATTLRYSKYRDMRGTVAVLPNKVTMRAPAEGSVPIEGAERTYGLQAIELADRMAATLTNPVAADDSSLARGERKFRRLCVPCHGPAMAGNGPVAALFMPPPDLLAQPTRERKDGYLYAYIRHGGAVMPAYGAQTTEREAWDVINYIRARQKASPR